MFNWLGSTRTISISSQLSQIWLEKNNLSLCTMNITFFPGLFVQFDTSANINANFKNQTKSIFSLKLHNQKIMTQNNAYFFNTQEIILVNKNLFLKTRN